MYLKRLWIKDPSSSKGFAFVEFYTVEEAETFMKAYGKDRKYRKHI